MDLRNTTQKIHNIMHFTSYDVSWNVFAFHKVLYLENMKRKKSGGDFINNRKIDKVLKYVF